MSFTCIPNNADMVADVAFIVFMVLFLVSVFVCLLWMVYRMGYRRWSHLTNRGLPYPVATPFDEQIPCTCEVRCARHPVSIPESVRIGSVFCSIPLCKVPKFQAAVYSMNAKGQPMDYKGVAVRMDDWLIMPQHIYVTAEKLLLMTYGKTKPNVLLVETSKFMTIEADIGAIRLGEADFSILGLVKPRIGTVEEKVHATISSATKEPEMSFGILRGDKEVFGGVLYEGSTKYGFSGAAYHSGNQVYGIHLGGGVLNYGMNASYIMALLSTQETTAEWLEKIRRAKGGKLQYRRSPYDPGEVVVYVNGRYHVVDRADIEDDDEDVEDDMGDQYDAGGPEEGSTGLGYRQQDRQKLKLVKGRTLRGEFTTVFANSTSGMRERDVEMMRAKVEPPHYDDVEADSVSAISEKIQSKNAQVAEMQDISAKHLEELDQFRRVMLDQLTEKYQEIKGAADNVATRYREVQKLLTEVPKTEKVARQDLVQENEMLKGRLTELNKLLKDANVKKASAQAIPKAVKAAKNRVAGADLLNKFDKAMVGYDRKDLINALVAAGVVTSVGNTLVMADESSSADQTQPSTSSKTV